MEELKEVGKEKDIATSRSADKTLLYKRKYKVLRKYMMAVVFENLALCNETSRLQQKLLSIKFDNFKLKRALQNMKRGQPMSSGSRKTNGTQKAEKKNVTNPVKKKARFKTFVDGAVKPIPVPKRKCKRNPKKIQTLSVSKDVFGQLSFPLALDDTSIHSLGDILSDKHAYHTDSDIYPVGYVSKRTYGDVQNPYNKCIYTCKILSNGPVPRFEIISENGITFVGNTPDECHQQLLNMINSRFSGPVINENVDFGADFFGLTNSTVHYLILSLPNVSKCSNYSFQKFKEKTNYNSTQKNVIDICTKYESLVNILPTHDQNEEIEIEVVGPEVC